MSILDSKRNPRNHHFLTEIWDISLFGRKVTDTILETSRINETTDYEHCNEQEISTPVVSWEYSTKTDPSDLGEENSEDEIINIKNIEDNIQSTLIPSLSSLSTSSIVTDQEASSRADLITVDKSTMEVSNQTSVENSLSNNESSSQSSNIKNIPRSSRNSNINYNIDKYKSNKITLQQLRKHFTSKNYDPHLLVPPQVYGHCQKELCPLDKQPFEIKVDSSVGFLTDIHSHLCDAEIIGLLAGKWVRESKTLFIHAAFPCTATDRGGFDDGSTDVELDPEAEFKVREVILSMDLQVVGWYHSHPKFRPDPSITDIINQAQYQQFLRDEESGIDPFVGLIVGTYGVNSSTPAGEHQWFHVHPVNNEHSSNSSNNNNNNNNIGVSNPTVYCPMLLQVKYRPLPLCQLSQSSPNKSPNRVKEEISYKTTKENVNLLLTKFYSEIETQCSCHSNNSNGNSDDHQQAGISTNTDDDVDDDDNNSNNDASDDENDNNDDADSDYNEERKIPLGRLAAKTATTTTTTDIKLNRNKRVLTTNTSPTSNTISNNKKQSNSKNNIKLITHKNNEVDPWINETVCLRDGSAGIVIKRDFGWYHIQSITTGIIEKSKPSWLSKHPKMVKKEISVIDKDDPWVNETVYLPDGTPGIVIKREAGWYHIQSISTGEMTKERTGNAHKQTPCWLKKYISTSSYIKEEENRANINKNEHNELELLIDNDTNNVTNNCMDTLSNSVNNSNSNEVMITDNTTVDNSKTTIDIDILKNIKTFDTDSVILPSVALSTDTKTTTDDENISRNSSSSLSLISTNKTDILPNLSNMLIHESIYTNHDDNIAKLISDTSSQKSEHNTTTTLMHFHGSGGPISIIDNDDNLNNNNNSNSNSSSNSHNDIVNDTNIHKENSVSNSDVRPQSKSNSEVPLQSSQQLNLLNCENVSVNTTNSSSGSSNDSNHDVNLKMIEMLNQLENDFNDNDKKNGIINNKHTTSEVKRKYIKHIRKEIPVDKRRSMRVSSSQEINITGTVDDIENSKTVDPIIDSENKNMDIENEEKHKITNRTNSIIATKKRGKYVKTDYKDLDSIKALIAKSCPSLKVADHFTQNQLLEVMKHSKTGAVAKIPFVNKDGTEKWLIIGNVVYGHSKIYTLEEEAKRMKRGAISCENKELVPKPKKVSRDVIPVGLEPPILRIKRNHEIKQHEKRNSSINPTTLRIKRNLEITQEDQRNLSTSNKKLKSNHNETNNRLINTKKVQIKKVEVSRPTNNRIDSKQLNSKKNKNDTTDSIVKNSITRKTNNSMIIDVDHEHNSALVEKISVKNIQHRSFLEFLSNKTSCSCCYASQLFCSTTASMMYMESFSHRIQSSLLMAILLGFYYSAHKRRIGLDIRWKDGLSKIDKLKLSLLQWCAPMGFSNIALNGNLNNTTNTATMTSTRNSSTNIITNSNNSNPHEIFYNNLVDQICEFLRLVWNETKSPLSTGSVNTTNIATVTVTETKFPVNSLKKKPGRKPKVAVGEVLITQKKKVFKHSTGPVKVYKTDNNNNNNNNNVQISMSQEKIRSKSVEASHKLKYEYKDELNKKRHFLQQLNFVSIF